MESVPKRRRLVGKQPASSVAEPVITPASTHQERTLVKTSVRDAWVAAEMRARGLSGHQARQRLRSEWTTVPLDVRARQMSTMTFPSELADAATSVERGWQTLQQPVVLGEPCVTRFRGNGTMFRWSGSWSRISDVGAAASIEELCVTLRQHPSVGSLWQSFLDFFQGVQKKFRLDRWTVALELHCEVTARTGVPSVHIHCMFDSAKSVSLAASDLRFRDAHPYASVDAPRARGRSTRRSYDQGHYYLQVPKVGGVCMQTNYRAFNSYPISPDWVTNLWQTNKISTTAARDEYVKCRKHVKAYLDNLAFCSQCERDQAIVEKKHAVEQALLPLQKKAARIEIVEAEFLPQYEKPMFRRRFLVLTGASCLGKTIFGCSLSGPGKTLVVDCGSADQPDLRPFNPLVHETIIFDECRASTVANNRKIFQGTTQNVALGHSATNIFTYSVWLHGVKMVVTSNRWHEDVAELPASDQAWLQHNAIVVNCIEKLYEA
ncbi:unnamed protein product [Effrenium voratum]|nr:unnamed protein product [Effrenium voratum]